MKNKIYALTIAVIIVVMLPMSAKAVYSSIKFDIDWESQGFIEMLTTAYMVSGTTATGPQTHAGICACNPRHGQVAVIYTLDGQYLGTFECVDSGSTDGLKAGTVIDVWFETYEECKEWMTITRGCCYVQWIDGDG